MELNVGPAERILSGPGALGMVSVGHEGRVMYATMRWKPAIWAAALDATRGTVAGEPREFKSDETVKMWPAVSRDGTKVAYEASGAF